MQGPRQSFTTPRPVLQGQPVSVMHFGANVNPPAETGYSYLPGTALSSVAAVPTRATFGTSKSPSSLGGLFSLPLPAAGVPFAQTNAPTQGNGVPNIATGNAGMYRGNNPYSFGPVQAVTIGGTQGAAQAQTGIGSRITTALFG